ncbi:hypothetical protein EMCRGX_G016415 [Ephydatia muelleri]
MVNNGMTTAKLNSAHQLSAAPCSATNLNVATRTVFNYTAMPHSWCLPPAYLPAYLLTHLPASTYLPPTPFPTCLSAHPPAHFPVHLPAINTLVYIIASVIVVIAIAVASIVAIVIIILVRKGVLRRKRRTPTQPTTDGLDNVIYNGSPPNVPMNNLVPMTAVIPYATYEPVNDIPQVNYDYLEEDCNPYLIPASHEEELYVQLESKKLKKIPRHQIEANEMLGSGQFGGVQIGIWNGSIGRREVAIKTLNPTITQPDAKVKFLQEAAIMAQFRHPYIIQLYGIVLDGEPIADFGLSRDLADDTYYVSHGGMVPIKWTAPEAIHFKKYSTASDVWSYGCLLYEIWSMGMKPFEEIINSEVVQKIDSGYRLPPPPGCPQLIYQNPETHSRPLFGEIYQSLCQSEELVLAIPSDVHLIHPNAGMVGASLEAGENLYIELQKCYLQV